MFSSKTKTNKKIIYFQFKKKRHELRIINIIPHIANILIMSKSSVENHLHQVGYVNQFDIWVLHKWKKHLLDHISASDLLFKHEKNILVLKQIVSGDKKWILYNNVKQKRSWGKLNKPPLVFIQRKWCHAYAEVGREFSIMSIFWTIKQLISTSTTPN